MIEWGVESDPVLGGSWTPYRAFVQVDGLRVWASYFSNLEHAVRRARVESDAMCVKLGQEAVAVDGELDLNFAIINNYRHA